MNGVSRGKKHLHAEITVISLRDLLETLLFNTRALMLFFISFLVFGVIYAEFKAPVFQSRALLQVSKSNNGSSLLSKLSSGSLGGLSGATQAVASQQYIFHSPSVMEMAIRKYHLDVIVTPWHFPIIGTALANHYDQNPNNLYFGPAKSPFTLSRYSWGGDSVTVNQFSIPEPLQGKNFTLIYLNNHHYQLWLGKKIILSGEEGKLISNQSNTISLFISKINANPNTHFYIQKLSMLRAIKRLQSMIKVNQSGSQTNLISLHITGKPNAHLPSILTAVINNAIFLNIQSRAQKAQKVLDFMGNQLPIMRARLSRINSKLSGMLPMGAKFENLEQEKNIENLVYSNLLLNTERYDIQKASSLGDLFVLTPPSPILSGLLIPNWLLTCLIMFAGVLLGILFVFARHYMLGIAFDPERIEQITGLHLLTSLQKTDAQANQMILFQKKRITHLKLMSELDVNSPVLEGIRSLRTSLLLNYFADHANKAQKNNIMTINGPTPSIGKSFVAVNLAQQFAEIDKRILLIDADLRKGTIKNYFEPWCSDGFVDLLNGSRDAHRCIQKTRFKNLDIILSGKLEGQNANLLSKENIARVLTPLSLQYDYIVIDTAPVLLVSDALSICQHAAVNLMLFAYGKHNEREIDIAIKCFEKSNIVLHGFMMNFMPVPKLGYGYGYGYSEKSTV